MKKIILALMFLFPIFMHAQDIIIDERITKVFFKQTLQLARTHRGVKTRF
ncbi:MAG: hypothetical protein LBO72_01485 [Helicobacteraceae bacterium]|nr:hypothetical protein [Helicobacteraceae bacterium]